MYRGQMIFPMPEYLLSPLRNLLMGFSDPKKSMRLILAFCAMSVLHIRSRVPVEQRRPIEVFTHMEQTILQQIMCMMDATFFRQDVVAILDDWNRLYVSYLEPVWNSDRATFQQSFVEYVSRAAWFRVMNRDVLQVLRMPLLLPPPQPQPVQPPIEDIIV